MNRALWIILPILVVGLFAATIAGAYHAGTRHDDDNHAIVQALGTATTADGQPVQVVRVYDDHYGRHGFFPFFFIGPLFFILLLVLFFGLFRRGRWGWRGYGPEGPWGPRPFEEWHERQHARDTDTRDEQPKP
jgi:cell division protein FtsW (lipid II flippase)